MFYYKLLLTCSCFTFISTENEFQTLVNIVTKNIEDSETYNLPKNNNESVFTTSAEVQEYGQFDFIIVGAGSSGCVLADKLSKNGKWKVLLLEAGSDDTKFSDIPGMASFLLKSKINWGYYSKPQTRSCQGMVNKQCLIPRGKVMGGSSTINFMIYTRGNREDYNLWQQMGNDGWSYDEVEPYFRQLENWQTYGDLNLHGFGGPINCNRTAPATALKQPVSEALLSMGMKQLDYNGKSQLGFDEPVLNIDYNKRVSSAFAFIRNISSRPNLKISKNSFVTKIIIDETLGVTEGVEFVKDNVRYRSLAAREVILSAGAINTPQILMLSGIGPKEELEQHNIKLIKDLPVGKFLQDHPRFDGFVVRTNISDIRYNLTENLRRYMFASRPLTSPIPLEIVGFLNLDKRGTVPDIEFVAGFQGEYSDYVKFVNNADDQYKNYLSTFSAVTDFKIYLALLHPKARGNITLKSKNPADFPIVDLNYFSDNCNKDINKLYKAIKYFERVLETPAMKAINATLAIPNEICHEHKLKSKQFWYCIIEFFTQSTFHPVGTTRMGKFSNDSVVNNELKVHGIRKLRVVDAGIMPEITSAHPNVPTMMLAWKISDKIIKEYDE
ncbi:alcohol dehydrogenase [acceptor] [Aethina tumida]|uniref:alcohol dehydrogenase [acceptor] n=1 Tax=Aethina tumida TaxID=116153 RepID=UPI00214731D1|nr:alcohol dehydrogenase [acceptor] [Aethina tumida]